MHQSSPVAYGYDPQVNVLEGFGPVGHIVVACSGGADSLALAHLAVVAARIRGGVPRISACVIDHALQPQSAAVAARAAEQCLALGVDDAAVIEVAVTERGEGLEAAARHARRNALLSHASALGAEEIWLGHTLEDQAETVLIGLTHGSGARSLAGMRARDGIWVRPLLSCRRADVRAALPEHIVPWADPHNVDPRFLRSRVRAELLPAVESVLGDRAIVNLARTAELLNADSTYLDEIAKRSAADYLSTLPSGDISCARAEIAALPQPIRSRVIRDACLAAGVSPRELTSGHIHMVQRLFCESNIFGPIALPALRQATRLHDTVVLSHHPKE
jgi:tRNA(Ile)-lysidine synthase